MNLGHEQIPEIGPAITHQICRLITETDEAFIIQTITPYCEQQAGRRLEKAELKEIISKATPYHVGWGGYCPRCDLDLTKANRAYEVGIAYCPRCGQRVDWPKAPKEEAEE